MQSATKLHPFRIWLLIAVIIGLLGIMFGAKESASTPADRLPDGFDSTAVAKHMQELPGEETSTAVAVFSFDNPAAIGQLQAVASKLGGPLIPAQSGRAAMVPLEVPDGTNAQDKDTIAELRAKATEWLPDGVSVQVTGPAAIQADLAGVFSGANFLLLAVTAAIVAILLIITYRSPFLWLIPLLMIGIADRFAGVTFTHLLSATGVVWDESTSGILSVLVFGAGTDYALLLISRYRDELHRHENRFEAMQAAWWPTAKSVIASATTVMLGMLCLLLSLVPATRGLGLACAYGIVVAAAFALLALPGALVLFGRWIFWPRVPKDGEPQHAAVWEKVGNLVRSHATAVMTASILVLIAAGTLLFGSRVGLETSEQFMDTPESISAAETLEREFQADATPANVWAKDVAATTKEIEQLGGRVMSTKEDVLLVSGPSVDELRAGLSNATVGGPEAENQDNIAAAKRDQLVVFPLLALLVTLALGFLLRSWVAPLIMVSTVILTYFSAMGLSWLVFQHVFKFSAIAETTPLYAFVFLVALGVDYNIFLITRAKEEATHVGTREGILKALSSTGGVITSAGILLASVFAALGVLPLIALAQMGVVIFIGVLIDTLLVRTVVMPAIVMKLGDTFWK
ncbi:Putative membrane protein YdgH [Corynebacterium kalinowskii]|uniref:Membrane protein YdgH n=1 Tax=Corynebacterium kalinowskii TaxID=2675216 RepID=A0A6B8VLD5_9CORY|nr:MMPL family transporter [Corynebacterium kalinowskii]QGU02264.1 Putative membrane protein YdgH [Corynebacterium kalinowskii]